MGHKIVEKYVQDLKRRNARANNIRSAKWQLNKFYDWTRQNGIRSYQHITKDHILDYRYYLIHDYRTKQGNSLKNNSVNAFIMILRVHFEWLKKTGRRRDNPTLDFDDKIYLEQNTSDADIKYLVPEEINKLKEWMSKRRRGKQYLVLTRLTFEEGLRIGEALALDVEDINFTDQTIRINKSLNKDNKVGPTKTRKSNRKITVSKSILSDIQDYLDSEERQEGKALFSTKCKHTRLSYPAALDMIKVADRDLNFRYKLTWHLGRHSAATNKLAAGIPIYDVKHHLGHENIATTARYLHLIESRQKEYAEMSHSYFQNQNGQQIQGTDDNFSKILQLVQRNDLSKEQKSQIIDALL